MTSARRLILVTGTPRSGTTPIGDALAAAPRTRTLYEPLNFHVGDRRVRRYFEIPGAGGFAEADADELVRDIGRLRLRLRPGLFPEDRGLRRAVKRFTGSRTTSTYRAARLDARARTIVWKDPFAAFLAARVAAVHAIPVIATFRPPHAVAASFKRLGWRFDVDDLVSRLAATGFQPDQLEAEWDLSQPAINAAALWRLVNAELLRAAQERPAVCLVDMDAVVADRDGVIRRLYARLGLQWTSRTEAHLDRSAKGEGPAAPQTTRAHGGRRDPAAVNRYWVDVLTAEEADAVSRITDGLHDRLRAHATTVSGQLQPPQP